MSEEIAVLGPLPAPSTTWLQMGSGANVLDAPSYVDGVAQSVSILLFPGKSTGGRCYLEVYQRTGDRFTRRQSTPVALDVTVSQLQTVSVKPMPVSRGEYVGLRMEGGSLFTQWTDGAPAHMWWDVDPVAGTAGRYVSMVSSGFAVTLAAPYVADRTWHALYPGPLQSGPVLRWTAHEQPGTYLYLPTAFHLGIGPSSGLPGIEPYLYLRDGAGPMPSLADYRVRLRLVAVPVLTSAERERLRTEIRKVTGRPAVRLQRATGLPARLQITIGPESAASPAPGDLAVDLASGFTLEYDLPASDYALVREQLLAPGGGIRGKVYVPLGPQDQGVIDVWLSLQQVSVDVVAVQWPEPSTPGFRHAVGPALMDPARRNLLNVLKLRVSHHGVGDAKATVSSIFSPGLPLRNQLDQAVRVSRVYGLMGAGSYDPPSQVSAAQVATPIDLPAGGTASVPLTLHERTGSWHLWDLEINDVTIPGSSPARWIDRIDRAPATGNALLPVAVYVTNLAQRKAEDPDFVGVEVAVRGAIPPDGVLRADASEPWRSQLARSLSEIVGGSGATGFDVEITNLYTGGRGLPQRIASAGENAVLSALAPERPGCRYAILAHGGGVLSDGLDRAAAEAALEDLAAQGRRWQLAVRDAPPAP